MRTIQRMGHLIVALWAVIVGASVAWAAPESDSAAESQAPRRSRIHLGLEDRYLSLHVGEESTPEVEAEDLSDRWDSLLEQVYREDYHENPFDFELPDIDSSRIIERELIPPTDQMTVDIFRGFHRKAFKYIRKRYYKYYRRDMARLSFQVNSRATLVGRYAFRNALTFAERNRYGLWTLTYPYYLKEYRNAWRVRVHGERTNIIKFGRWLRLDNRLRFKFSFSKFLETFFQTQPDTFQREVSRILQEPVYRVRYTPRGNIYTGETVNVDAKLRYRPKLRLGDEFLEGLFNKFSLRLKIGFFDRWTRQQFMVFKAKVEWRPYEEEWDAVAELVLLRF